MTLLNRASLFPNAYLTYKYTFQDIAFCDLHDNFNGASNRLYTYKYVCR